MEPSTSWSQATIVVITGGSSGIGRAAALAFADAAAAAGALSQQRVARPLALVIADVDQEGGEETCLLARQRGADAADFMKTDVRIEQDVAALGAWVGSRYGKLHYAVINAGVEGARALTHEYPTDAFDGLMAVNLRGSWLCLKHLLPLMLAAGRDAAAVITSSTAGLAGMPEFAPYSASKHALIGLARSAALEYAGRVRVNCVCPATTDTPMVARFAQQWPEWQASTNASYPIGRIARPEEVAGAILWLCTAATFTTGTHVVLDGGAGA